MANRSLTAWLNKCGWEIALTVALAAALAISTNSTATQSLRYLAAFAGLGSLMQVILAVVRKRPLSDRLSEWDEGIVLATVSAGAHLVAVHIDKATGGK